LAEAKGWRADASGAIRKGELRAAPKLSLREAAEAWLTAAEGGEILSNREKPYKPSSLRGYRHDLQTYIFPALGARRLGDVSYEDLEALIGRLRARGLSASKVRSVVVPLQAIYRKHRRQVPVDPTRGLRLPKSAAPRERAASPAEAARLLDALPEEARALWATALYAGLRRGELRGLRDEDVDLDDNVIHVRRGWDDKIGEIEPKSEKGARRAPITPILRQYLLEHRARTGRRGSALFFGRTPTEAFSQTTVRNQALKSWTAAGLEPIGLHECRHTFVSMMAAAGIPLERIGDYVGHSSSYMVDRYRHLIEGQRDDDAARLNQYLSAAPH
jgi:integrase